MLTVKTLIKSLASKNRSLDTYSKILQASLASLAIAGACAAGLLGYALLRLRQIDWCARLRPSTRN